MSKHGEIPDSKQIKEILDVVSEKVPDLLKELSGVLYSPEQAKKFGLAGAIFYKELKAAGMTDDQAYTLTQQYMSTMSLGSTIKDIARHQGGVHGGHDWNKNQKTKSPA
jgi:hypothetical protein